jgi:nitrate reductase gamma subunit
MSDVLLFAVLPYVAMFTFFLATIQRYRQKTFSYSSLSSQFLENKKHFWSLVPFHYGILVVLAGHIVAFLFPCELLAFNAKPVRLYILEITALTGGLMTVIGLVAAMVRRWTTPKIRVVTTFSDWAVYALLLLQVAGGVHIAVAHPWGSSWFASSISPYLWSLVRFAPEVTTVAPMPWAVKLHIVNAWLLIGLFPFTRLVHVLVIPNPYLWRKPQVVRWARRSQRHPA